MYSGVEIQNLISSNSYGKHDFGNVCQKRVPSDVQNKKKKLEQNVAASIGMSENNYGQFKQCDQPTSNIFWGNLSYITKHFQGFGLFFLISVMTDPILSPW